MLQRFQNYIREELDSSPEGRHFGSGWLSGVAALIGSCAGLGIMLCIMFPFLLTTPELREHYASLPYRLVLHAVLIVSFCLACLSMILRGSKVLGFTSIVLILLTTLIGNFEGKIIAPDRNMFFGLDWFILNVLLSGLLFVPIERFIPRWAGQPLFRDEWREDLFYYFVSSMMVQILTFLSLWPSQQIVAHTSWQEFKLMVSAQPIILQFIEIMFLTDLLQYWVHRGFHKFPALWRFHAVHHSAKTMDWMAGARMHFIEILILRGLTVIPMMVLGFSEIAVQAYILAVYLYSTFIHGNIGWSPRSLSGVLVTPRYHHWHHGIEREAIDVNFAIHFPVLDKVFGTYHMPEDRWPSGYGIKGHPVPKGYLRQFLYPFKKG